MDVDKQIRLARRGQAIAVQGPHQRLPARRLGRGKAALGQNQAANDPLVLRRPILQHHLALHLLVLQQLAVHRRLGKQAINTPQLELFGGRQPTKQDVIAHPPVNALAGRFRRPATLPHYSPDYDWII